MAEIIQTHMIIGPDSSAWTESIPFEYIQTLLNMGILGETETVEHGSTPNGVKVQTIIYRAKIEKNSGPVASPKQEPIRVKMPPRTPGYYHA